MSITEFFKKIFHKKEVVALPEPVPVLEVPDHPALDAKLKLALIVGHTKELKGASLATTDLKEYDYNLKIARAIKTLAEKIEAPVEVEIILRDFIGINGAYARAAQLGCDAAIELHFNAFDCKAEGSLTLCTADVKDVDFSQGIHKAVCKVFGRNGESMGVKSISKSVRGAGVHMFPSGPNCLVEPFFGDNPTEAAMGLKYSGEYAEALLTAVVLWGRQVDLIK